MRHHRYRLSVPPPETESAAKLHGLWFNFLSARIGLKHVAKPVQRHAHDRKPNEPSAGAGAVQIFSGIFACVQRERVRKVHGVG